MSKRFDDRELSAQGAKAAERLLPYLERGKTERFGVELSVGPEEAEFFLASNPDNRNFRPTKIAQFVKDMRHGRWQSNGEPVIIASTGELNDGQHRLSAIVQTGIPQKMMVAFGYPRDTRFTVDSGAARTAGDQLGMAGMAYGSAIAATSRLVISYEQVGGRSLGRSSAVTSLEQQERAKSDILLQEIVIYCDKHRPAFIRTTLLATAFYILSRVAPREAKEYIDGIISGVGLKATDPAYVVRERLMQAKAIEQASNRSKKGLTEQGMLEVIFRGWNYYASNKGTANKIQVMGTLPLLRTPKKAGAAVREPEVDEAGLESVLPYDPATIPAGSPELEAA